jgi:hypothetical protein
MRNEDILTKTAKSKIVLGIIEDLKEYKDCGYIYIDTYYNDDSDIMKKIAKRSGIRIGERLEAGMVDISEFITITYDNIEEREVKRIMGREKQIRSTGNFMGREFNFDVSEGLKEKVKLFEEKNIPSFGTCNTHIGEMFRAIQRIQYRAYNDGDLCWEVGSPSFMSYIFLMSQIDLLNYSSAAYDNETGDYSFEFTDEYLIKNSWDGKISDVIEDTLADTADFIKYQLMDLLDNGKIEDSENRYDSRDYTSLRKQESRYW